MRYTTSPSWYLEPFSHRILRVADREGLTEVTLDEQNLIADFCNKSVGAQVRRFDPDAHADEAAQYAQDKISVLKEMGMLETSDPWSAYDWDDPFESSWGPDEAEYLSIFTQEYMGFVRSVHELLSTFDLNRIPGESELIKSVRLVMLLRIAKDINRHEQSPSIRDPKSSIEDAVEKAEEFTDKIPDLSGEDPEEKAEAEAQFIQVMELVVKQVDIAEMLRVARLLEGVSELNAYHATPHPDPDGEDAVLRAIETLAELPRTPQATWGLPWSLLAYRALTGELQVRQPITTREKRQLLFAVLDGTGSMQGPNAGRAAGVILNRLEAVVRGEAVMYLRFFDTKLHEHEYLADSPESAAALMDVVTSPFSYLGTDTRFQEPLEAASARVKELVRTGELRDEEIFFVTDGYASVPDVSILGGTKLHCIQVGYKEEEELAELSRKSGGINLFVTEQSES